MSAHFILLLIIPCSASYFNCSATDSCQDTIMNCQDGVPCVVNCIGETSCARNTFIYGNAATNLTVNCDKNNACNQLQVFCGRITGQCLLDCKENGDYDNVCKDEDLYCGSSQCSINCGDYKACGANPTVTINSSTTNSFQCYGSQCPSSFTSIEFTDTPTLESTNNPSIPAITNIPTTSHPSSLQPTTINLTSNNPTSYSPTNNPTTYDEYNPTIIPTNNPSSGNPTTTTPTKRPTIPPFSVDTTNTNPMYISTETITIDISSVSKSSKVQNVQNKESFITMNYFIITAFCFGGVFGFCALSVCCCFFIYLYYKHQQKRIIGEMSAELGTNETCTINMEETEEDSSSHSSSSTSSSSPSSSNSSSTVSSSGILESGIVEIDAKMEGENSEHAHNALITDYANNGYISQIYKIDNISYAPSIIYQLPPAILSNIQYHYQVNSNSRDEIQIIGSTERRRQHRISDGTHATDTTIPNIPDDI